MISAEYQKLGTFCFELGFDGSYQPIVNQQLNNFGKKDNN